MLVMVLVRTVLVGGVPMMDVLTREDAWTTACQVV